MSGINFSWIRGDDEMETLIFTDEQGEPLDFSGSRFDCDIVPSGGLGEPIRLSTTTGEIRVAQNEVTLIISHDKTERAEWKAAVYDLQQTNAQGLVKTLCGGKISLQKDATRAPLGTLYIGGKGDANFISYTPLGDIPDKGDKDVRLPGIVWTTGDEWPEREA